MLQFLIKYFTVFLGALFILTGCGVTKLQIVDQSNNEKYGIVEMYVYDESFEFKNLLINGVKVTTWNSFSGARENFVSARFLLKPGKQSFKIGSMGLTLDVKENNKYLVKLETEIMHVSSQTYGNYRETTTSYLIKVIPHPVILPFPTDEQSILSLKGFLKHEDWYVRYNAVELLQKIKNDEVKKLLEEIAKNDTNSDVRQIALQDQKDKDKAFEIKH